MMHAEPRTTICFGFWTGFGIPNPCNHRLRSHRPYQPGQADLDSGVLVAAATTPCPALPAARPCVVVAQADHRDHPGRGRTSGHPTSLQGEAVAWANRGHAATVLPVTTST